MRSIKRWASALLALLLMVSLSAPAALAADPVFRETTGNVNIRSGAGTNYTILVTVPKGDVVEVTNWMLKSWWKVKYTNADNKIFEGYMSSDWLKETNKRSNKRTEPEKPKNLRALGCYSTTGSLTLRSGAGSSYRAITSVPRGDVVNVTDTKSVDWSKCTYINKKGKKYTGFLNAHYLSKAAEPYKVKSKTELRRSASTSSKNLQTMPKGSYLFVTATYSSKWFKVRYPDINGNSHYGYVLRSKVRKTTVTNKPYKQVDPEAEAKWMAEQWRTKDRYTLTAKATLTASASSKGKKVASLSKGAVVAKTGSSGKFYKVVYNTSSNKKKLGYLPKSKLTKYKDSKAGDYVTTVSTPLRKNDSQTAPVLVSLGSYTLFTVKDTSEKDWYWASYTDSNGKKYTGFVYKSHAKKYEEQNAGNYCATVKTPLRKADNDTASVLQSIPQGSVVKVKRTYNPNWYYVSYTDADGETEKGYVASAYLNTFQSQKLDYVAFVPTTMRIQPNDSAKSTEGGKIKAGQAVTVNDTPVKDWYWASFTDDSGTKHTGFVYAPHLQTKEEYEAAQQTDSGSQSGDDSSLQQQIAEEEEEPSVETQAAEASEDEASEDEVDADADASAEGEDLAA